MFGRPGEIFPGRFLFYPSSFDPLPLFVHGRPEGAFAVGEAAQIWREAYTPEDDPALRILGPHGRLLDGVALEAHCGDAGEEAAQSVESRTPEELWFNAYGGGARAGGRGA